MAESESRYVNVLLEDELLRRIDDFRFENRLPSRTEAIRRLIERGLGSDQAKMRKQSK